MNNDSSSDPENIHPVRVKRHRVDWEASDLDLAEITAQRVVTLAPQIATGAWFLNPAYTVSSPNPSAEFFRTVLNLRSAWLRTCRQIMGNSGQRRLARYAETQGRRGVLLDSNADDSPDESGCRAKISVFPSSLPHAHRRELIETGQIAKQLGLSGILFIDGNPIPPRSWQSRANELLNTGADVPVIITRRKLDLATLKATKDVEPLRTVCRAALQEHMDRRPTHAAYVCPQVTVSAHAATHGFYEAVTRCQGQWCILLNRALKCGNVRRAIRDADDATIALVYRGALVADGQLYLPGCWPIHAPKPGRLKKTPFQCSTVPPDFLGLIDSQDALFSN